MKDIIRLVRPKQWLKNVFVLIPVFFGGRLSDVHDLLATAFAFVAFSFAASSIYCFNDIIDADADRRHPVKCSRPVARGYCSHFVSCSVADIFPSSPPHKRSAWEVSSPVIGCSTLPIARG